MLCIAQRTEQEHHEASSRGPGEEASVYAMKALGRSLHDAYCIAQSTEQEHLKASSPGPGRAGQEASVNAMKCKCHEMV